MDCKLRAKNCGGCPMLGMDYAAQLKQKEETVKKLLGRFGPVEHIRGMETPYHYRNKVISTFTTGWGGKLTSGIYAANSHKVLPVESCLLQDEVLDKTMLAVRAAAGTCHYQPFNEDKGTGLLRHCLLRRGVMTGQVMVVLVTAQPVLPGAKNFVKALLTEAGKQGVAITTIVQNVNDRKTSVVLGEAEKVLYGKGFILDTLCGKTYAISPRSFYQINHTQTEVLYGLAVDAAHLTGKEVVLDAYCGIGTIGLTAADHAKQVVGVEVNREAVHDAIGNVPVVEKQILWSKRCKDEALRGTVKETIMQVSRSKKWLSKPAVDKDGKPILQVNGKPVLRKSYSVLQDDFFQHMRAAGYTDVERGERDSTEEHLTVTQFKVAKEKQRLEAVTAELNQKEAQLDDTTQAAEKKKQELKSLQAQTKAATGIAVTVQELESMGKKSFTGNIVLTPDECRTLKNYAVSSFAEKAEKLKYQQKYETAKKDAGVWKKRYEKLLEQAQPYLDAVKLAPERVRAFLNAVLTRGKEKQDIPQERGRKRKESTIDR